MLPNQERMSQNLTQNQLERERIRFNQADSVPQRKQSRQRTRTRPAKK